MQRPNDFDILYKKTKSNLKNINNICKKQCVFANKCPYANNKMMRQPDWCRCGNQFYYKKRTSRKPRSLDKKYTIITHNTFPLMTRWGLCSVKCQIKSCLRKNTNAAEMPTWCKCKSFSQEYYIERDLQPVRTRNQSKDPYTGFGFSDKIIVNVYGGVAYCDDDRVLIIDHD